MLYLLYGGRGFEFSGVLIHVSWLLLDWSEKFWLLFFKERKWSGKFPCIGCPVGWWSNGSFGFKDLQIFLKLREWLQCIGLDISVLTATVWGQALCPAVLTLALNQSIKTFWTCRSSGWCYYLARTGDKEGRGARNESGSFSQRGHSLRWYLHSAVRKCLECTFHHMAN